MAKDSFDYEQSWSRKDDTVDRKERERIRQTLEMIPPDVRSVLDAGCGDGRVSSSLSNRYTVVRFDISSSALQRGKKRNGVAGVLTAIPFPDRAFDLVLACEVIEHIEPELLPMVLGEVERVSRKYVLITVPYREALEEAVVRCPCGFLFHKWGHLQVFDERKLQSLYADLRTEGVAYLGDSKPAAARLLKKLMQTWAGIYANPDPDTVCPRCGGQSFIAQRDRLSQILVKATSVIPRALPRRRATWVGAVFEKSTVSYG